MDNIPSAPVAKRQGGLGIASFVMSIVLGVAIFVIFIIAGIMETSTPAGIDENSPQAVILGLVIIGALLLVGVGVILGIADFFSKGRGHLFAILGLIFNGMILVGTILLILVGMASGN